MKLADRKIILTMKYEGLNEEWTEKCAFILSEGSVRPVCLICIETVAIVKCGNVK